MPKHTAGKIFQHIVYLTYLDYDLIKSLNSIIRGIVNFNDIKDIANFNKSQQIQILSEQNKMEIIDKRAIKDFVESLQYPLYM
jgi:hypothetical protein